MGRRAEAASSAEVGDFFPRLAMTKYPLGLGACGDHARGGGVCLKAWCLVGGRAPGVVSLQACGLGLCFRPESGPLLMLVCLPEMLVFLAYG